MRIALSVVVSLFLSSFNPASARAEYTAGAAGAGTISGTVTFDGPKPASAPIARDRSPDVCGTSGPDESLIVGDNGGVKNAVVYLSNIKTGKPLSRATVNFDQRGCTYVPHLVAVPVGSTLNLLNSDAVLHNIDARGPTSFNYAMPMGLKKIPKKLTKPGFLSVKCDVHPWMSGVIAVMENPYFAVTGEDGHFSLEGVPPGTYTLAVWHETLQPQNHVVQVPAHGVVDSSFKLTK